MNSDKPIDSTRSSLKTVPEMHLILLLCLCYPETWRFIHHQRTRPSPFAKLDRTLFSSQHFGVIYDIRYRQSFRYRLGSQRFVPVLCEADALPCTITGQSTVVPFRVCPNCVLGSRCRAGSSWFAKESFYRPDSSVPGFILLRNLVEYNTVCLLRPFKVCGHRFYLPLASLWLDI